MTRRILAAFSRTLHPTPTPPEVHFHQRSAGLPDACFDARCDMPRLDVG
jgi:hypothetical protein